MSLPSSGEGAVLVSSFEKGMKRAMLQGKSEIQDQVEGSGKLGELRILKSLPGPDPIV